jgi:lactose/cellobiose-specific phosphotransferase system IIC component
VRLKFIDRLVAVFADSRIVRTINNALINLIPFVLVGAVGIALLNLPIPLYQDALNTLLNGSWLTISRIVTFATLDVIAVTSLLSVAHVYASEEPSVKSGIIHPFTPTFTAFACYLILIVWDGGPAPIISHSGQSSVFTSLLIALSSSWLFFSFVRIWDKLKPPRLSALDTNLQMRTAFRAVFPVMLTLLLFALAKTLLPLVIPVDSLQAAFSSFIKDYLMGDTFGSVLLTVLLMQLLWFFGAHGTGMMLSLFPLVSTSAPSSAASSQVLFATQDFYTHFVALGGSGATLGLLIALFIVGSRHKGRRLAKASILPSIFNINEILLYGVPLILNPFYLLPFLLAPLLSATLCFAAFSAGLVPPITQSVSWTTPVIFSGYLSTTSVAGSLLQLVCLACSTALYMPFILRNRSFDARRRKERLGRLHEASLKVAADEGGSVLLRNDAVGESARELSARFHSYFETDTVPFHMVYQPKTDKDGRVMGAEALLRWHHPDFGALSPIMIVELCDESGLATSLGRWIARETIAEYARWKRAGIEGLRLSINLHAPHLCEDSDFPAFLADLLKANDIAPGEIEFEITERLAMHANKTNKEALAQIRALGVELSIDDMGMGYSSLTYISDFDAKAVKIDASLVSDISTDEQQQEIISSIVALAEKLDLTVIVEGVETQEQVDALAALRVRYFQGYFFSRPLLPQDFIAFVTRTT